MVKVPKQLMDDTGRVIRVYLFLRYGLGLKIADRLTAKELKKLSQLIAQEKNSNWACQDIGHTSAPKKFRKNP